jgi:DNA-binding response OmpR family regulator
MLPVVLLVEDDILLLRLYARILRSPRYELEMATTPQQALSEALTAGDRLKLLITDQNLNGLGEALARDLCQRLPHLQVLILSGMDVETEYETLAKPFEVETLRKKVLEKLGLTE